ncbi:uncharacterized protein LOC121488779 [Vulpes lagopus]|uniref:uncharacterized protein LOC121488779 n=1 Tax=Vulpes lagopus TaxID=494514 RepID=UPI001BC91866|nr:uncharacterized protein LOC121488779 [Vulpes lagopus]
MQDIAITARILALTFLPSPLQPPTTTQLSPLRTPRAGSSARRRARTVRAAALCGPVCPALLPGAAVLRPRLRPGVPPPPPRHRLRPRLRPGAAFLRLRLGAAPAPQGRRLLGGGSAEADDAGHWAEVTWWGGGAGGPRTERLPELSPTGWRSGRCPARGGWGVPAGVTAPDGREPADPRTRSSSSLTLSRSPRLSRESHMFFEEWKEMEEEKRQPCKATRTSQCLVPKLVKPAEGNTRRGRCTCHFHSCPSIYSGGSANTQIDTDG